MKKKYFGLSLAKTSDIQEQANIKRSCLGMFVIAVALLILLGSVGVIGADAQSPAVPALGGPGPKPAAPVPMLIGPAAGANVPAVPASNPAGSSTAPVVPPVTVPSVPAQPPGPTLITVDPALTGTDLMNEIQRLQALTQKPAAVAGGTSTPPQLTPGEALKEYNKMKETQIKEGLNKVAEGAKTDVTVAYDQLTKLIQDYRLNDKEKEAAIQAYQKAADPQRTVIIRDAVVKDSQYGSMSPAQKALFNNKQDEFNAALKEFREKRDKLVAGSLDLFANVYEVTSWDKLKPKEKEYFGNNQAEFRTAQAKLTQTMPLTAQEIDFLTDRQTYLDKDAQLKEVTSQLAKEKDPSKRQDLNEKVQTLQGEVKSAFDAYSSKQSVAIAAAYERKIEDLKNELSQLRVEADTAEAGSKKNELERKIASKESELVQADYKMREAKGGLNFAEKLSEFVRSYNEFSGLGQYSGLFIDDKDMAKRRQEAEDFFCNTIMIGGTGCWSSKICEDEIDATVGGTAVVAKTVIGEPRGAARIQAEKSPPAIYYNETSYESTAVILYKISYFIYNSNEENMKYNLVFHNADGSTLRAFVKDRGLAPGASESRMRTSSIARYSSNEYLTACLTFSPQIVKLNGDKVSELCSGITSYGGGPTTLAEAQVTPSQQQSQEGEQAGGPQDFDGF